jgi:hypothetical protein
MVLGPQGPGRVGRRRGFILSLHPAFGQAGKAWRQHRCRFGASTHRLAQTTKILMISCIKRSPFVVHFFLLVILMFFFITGRGSAAEILRSARPLESGKSELIFYGLNRSNKNLKFNLSGSSLIQVPLSGGGTAQFFAAGDTSLRFRGEGRSNHASLTWRPGDGLQYNFRLGTGNYELKVPSGSSFNRIQSVSPGIIWGFGAGIPLMTDTLVTPAVSVGLSYSRSDYRMGRLKSGFNAPVSISQHFSLEEYQTEVRVSKRWKRWEPTIGLNVFRQKAFLIDRESAERVQGYRDGLSPFVNLIWEIFPREFIVVEVSGLDEMRFAAGLSVRFK